MCENNFKTITAYSYLRHFDNVRYYIPYNLDADECQLGLSDCEHICSNTEGSYTCSCRPGYDLALNMRSCEGNIII